MNLNKSLVNDVREGMLIVKMPKVKDKAEPIFKYAVDILNEIWPGNALAGSDVYYTGDPLSDLKYKCEQMRALFPRKLKVIDIFELDLDHTKHNATPAVSNKKDLYTREEITAIIDKATSIEDLKRRFNPLESTLKLRKRSSGNYKDKGYYLPGDKKWTIVIDSQDCQVLVPNPRGNG
jgi:hypothetical protein